MILKKILWSRLDHILPSEDEDYIIDPESYYYLYGETVLPSEWKKMEKKARMEKNVYVKQQINDFEIPSIVEN